MQQRQQRTAAGTTRLTDHRGIVECGIELVCPPASPANRLFLEKPLAQVRGLMFRPSLLLVLALSAVSGPSASQDMLGCDCDREAILASMQSASSIFEGRIVKAAMTSKDDMLIRIWAESSHVIRGAHVDSEAIVTSRPDACGIPAGIGRRLLFVIPTEGAVVTRCSGSALPEGPEWSNLRLALTTVELWDTNPDAIRRELGRTGRSTQEEFQSYFNLLAELDPDGKPQRTGNLVRYRKMTFEFSESTYAVRWEN